jgi:hypothetical protein
VGDFPSRSQAKCTCNRGEGHALRQRRAQRQRHTELKSSRASRPGAYPETILALCHPQTNKRQRGSHYYSSLNPCLPASPTQQTRTSHSHARLAKRQHYTAEARLVIARLLEIDHRTTAAIVADRLFQCLRLPAAGACVRDTKYPPSTVTSPAVADSALDCVVRTVHTSMH